MHSGTRPSAARWEDCTHSNRARANHGRVSDGWALCGPHDRQRNDLRCIRYVKCALGVAQSSRLPQAAENRTDASVRTTYNQEAMWIASTVAVSEDVGRRTALGPSHARWFARGSALGGSAHGMEVLQRARPARLVTLGIPTEYRTDATSDLSHDLASSRSWATGQGRDD